MKTLKVYSAIIAILTGVLTASAQQPAGANPAPQTAAPNSPTTTPAAQEKAAQPVPVKSSDDKPAVVPANGAAVAPGNGIRLNFRGVPLETVLDYLSKAAGFIINLETKVDGKVDVWSYQPLTKDEAVDLLASILNKNGYAVIRKEKMLTITTLEDARKKDIPVKQGNEPKSIPRTDEMITQIIPVRYANAVQMTRDLQQLLPSYANLTANESANSLVLTDTQADVHRMTEIVRALDTSIASISAIRVFPLRYADAKDLANVIKELFDTTANQQRGGRGGGGGGALGGGNPLQQFFNRGGGGFGGGPGGGGRGGAGQGGVATSEARQAASRVVAVADERTNSLVVSAPDEYIPNIEKLVEEIDKVVDDLTLVRVFHLKNADPTYMASQLAVLFPDETRSNQGNNQGFRGGFQFAGGGFGGRGGVGGRGGAASADSSDRMKKMGRVLSVPDARTASLIVSASAELMPQIAQMIEELDQDPARKQKVFVFSLENADVQNVTDLLTDMFQGNNQVSLRRNQNQQNNALNNRQQNTARGMGNNQGGANRTTGLGTIGGSSFGP